MRPALVLLALLFVAEAGAESPVRTWQGKKSATTERVVVLAASPAEVYLAVTAYEQWKALFSDVKMVRVKSGGGETPSSSSSPGPCVHSMLQEMVASQP